MHPNASQPFPSPTRASPAWQGLPENIVLTSEEIERALRRMDSGTSPGPDLLRVPHLSTILRLDQTPLPGLSGAETLCKVANRFIAGEFPDDVFQLFSAANLVAIPKGQPVDPSVNGSPGPMKHSPTNRTIRPLAIGNVIRRLVSIACLNRVKHEAATFLAPIQTCVGVASGTDMIVHEVRKCISEAEGDDSPFAIVQVDATNAFNAVSRAVLIDRLREVSPGLTRYVAALFRRPPRLRASNPQTGEIEFFISSEEGVQQGDPLSMLLFSIIIHPVLRKIAATCDLKLNLWFADDGHLGGHPAALKTALSVLCDEGAKLGFTLNFQKTLAHVNSSFHDTDCLSSRQIKTSDLSTGLTVLGSPVGGHEYVGEHVSKKLRELAELHQRILRLDQPQLAFCALRTALNACRLTYTLRTTPRTLTKDLSRQYDDLMRCTFESVHGRISDQGWDQTKLPLRHQGAGIPDVASIHDCAYFSSVADTAHARATLPTRRDPIDIISSARPAILAHFQSFGITQIPAEVQPLFTSTSSPGIPKLQSTLCRAVDKKRAQDFWNRGVPSGSERLKAPRDILSRLAHRQSLATIGGSAFLSALPTESSLAAPGSSYWPIQMRIYLQQPVIPENTECGHCGVIMDTMGHHALAGCPSGLSRFHRHDAVVSAFCRYVLRPARIVPRRETPGLIRGTDNRPADIFVTAADGFNSDFPSETEHALDITIRDIAGSSQLSKIRSALRSSNSGTSIIEKDKIREFQNKLRMAPASWRNPPFAFSPIGFDLNGAWGPRAIQVLQHCAALSSSITGESQHTISRRAVQQISQLISRCNAALIRSRIIRSAPFHTIPPLPT